MTTKDMIVQMLISVLLALAVVWALEAYSGRALTWKMAAVTALIAATVNFTVNVIRKKVENS